MLKAQYQSAEALGYSKTSPLPSTEWTRFTFMLKKNFDTRIFLDNVNVGSPEREDDEFPLNPEKMINLASRLSFFEWWSVENIQLSDLSLWRDIPGGGDWETWAGVTLPETLGNVLFLFRRNLKTVFSLWKRIKCFPFTLRRRNLKKQQSPVILDLCLRKTRAGKSHAYRDVIVFEKPRFQNVFFHTKTQSRRFQISPVWRAFSKSSVFVTD